VKWSASATVLAPISWGTTYLTITELLPDGRPLFVAAMRVVPAGIVLLAVGSLGPASRPRGSMWWHTGVLALANFAVFFPLLAVAVYRLPGGVAASLGGLQPLFVAGLSRVVAGTRPRSRDLAVGVAAALGVALVVVRPGAGLYVVGVLAAVGANLSFALGVVLTKRFPAPPNKLAATGWQLMMSGVLLALLATVVEGAPPALTSTNVAGFAYLSLVGTGLAFMLWFTGIRRLPAAAPPLLGLAAPITGATLGWVVLDQPLSAVQLVGFVVTLGAIGYGAVLAASGAERSAAVDHEPLTRDESGALGGQEADSVGDVLGSAHAPAWHGCEVRVPHLRGHIFVPFDWYEAGRDRVHGDAQRGHLTGPGAGEPDLRALRGHICRSERRRPIGDLGVDVDDAAELLPLHQR
jgi:probable blue pigment (indigoidine) exporter